MKRFKNVLVGVDLEEGDVLVSDNLAPPTAEAVAQAMWLAKTNSAFVTFFAVLPSVATDLDAETQMLLQEDHGKRTVADHATEVLAKLVATARQDGLTAASQLAYGKNWVEIIRQVLRARHDLVIVGTRHRGPVERMLVGSTGIKLLRKCPCPVWVTQPLPDRRLNSILVAHDLRPVGDLAMELGCSLAQLHEAQLHVLHAADFHFENSPDAPAEKPDAYRQRAEAHVAAQLSSFNLKHPVQMRFVTEAPDRAIQDYIEVERHGIQLLVMGTLARTGIPGLITGNTAERLLPWIPCSVLAVKPTGFESPVRLNQEPE